MIRFLASLKDMFLALTQAFKMLFSMEECFFEPTFKILAGWLIAFCRRHVFLPPNQWNQRPEKNGIIPNLFLEFKREMPNRVTIHSEDHLVTGISKDKNRIQSRSTR